MRHNKKYSIRNQLAIIFIALLAGTILACLLINNLFLKSFYQKSKQGEVVSAYYTVNELMNEYATTLDSDSFTYQFKQLCDNNNLSVVIVDSSFNIITSSSRKDDDNIQRLLSYIFKDNPNFIEENSVLSEEVDGSLKEQKKYRDKIVEYADNYSVHVSTDPRVGDDYIELWGTLDGGFMILIRTAVQSIKESASISNKFLMIIGCIAILLSGILIWFVTKEITDPILELTNISKKMTDLDFETKYTGEAVNEIGVLGQHFNQMSDALQKAIGELKNANNDLMIDLEKREKLDDMRREFLSSVSHELKTPIALIQGYAEGLKDGITDDPESAEFYCDVIIDETTKMNKLVKNLLTLNQLEFGFDSIEIERFDISVMVKNYIKSIDILLENANAQVELDFEDDIYVWADEFKTEEVLANYISNAINHLSGERKIIIKIRQNNNVARVSVYNTGEQIPEEAIGQIWNEFYKVDKARSREYGGSGVGLSIVKAIMDKMHQEYGVKNSDSGVEFYFDLDCKPE